MSSLLAIAESHVHALTWYIIFSVDGADYIALQYQLLVQVPLNDILNSKLIHELTGKTAPNDY